MTNGVCLPALGGQRGHLREAARLAMQDWNRSLTDWIEDARAASLTPEERARLGIARRGEQFARDAFEIYRNAPGDFQFVNRRHTPGDVLLQTVKELEDASLRIEADRNLSEEGKRARFTEHAIAPYKRLRGIRSALLKRMNEVAAESAAASGRAYNPGMSALELAQANELMREARSNPAMRTAVIKELTSTSDAPRTVRLRKFVLESHPLLHGLEDAILDLTRLRLEPSLPNELGDIEEKMAGVRAQLAHTEAAMDSIAAEADRPAFVEAGVLPKPMIEWTLEERAEFIETHGEDEFHATMGRDYAFHASARAAVPDSQDPEARDDPMQKELAKVQAENDLVSFFRSQIDTANAEVAAP